MTIFSSRKIERRTSLVETPGDSRRQRRLGTSLVETLVSMTLLGVIFIPMLFLSSAFFLAQLAKSRQNVDVSVNAARFANQFMEELNLTQRLLPESNTTEIHFSYYDNVRQTPIKRGYRLSTSGSFRTLEKLNYDAAADTWTAQSPYGSVAANQVLLPATAAFDYCDSGGCGMSAKNAVFVRLANWEFMPRKNVNRRLDFPTLDVHLSTGTSTEGVLLAQVPQELYSFTKTTPFGAAADLNMVNLNTTGQLFNYAGGIYGVNNASVLSTLLPATADYPGCYDGIVVSSQGRVFFGQSGASGQLRSWASDTGLSTLLPAAITSPGDGASIATAPDGRAFWAGAGATGNIYTWYNGVLSTLTPSAVNYPGVAYNTEVDPTTGRLFLGGGNQMFTWSSSKGFSTILSGTYSANGARRMVGNDGRFYFGPGNNTGNVLTWRDNGGAGVLSTILPATTSKPGFYAQAVSHANGRLFFGQNAAAGNLWTWYNGVLSTIITVDYPAFYDQIVASDFEDRVFFGNESASGNIYTWRSTTGLSTILPSNMDMSFHGRKFAVSPEDGRAFLGATRMWTYRNGVLSTLVNSNWIMEGSVKVLPNGRVYFGASSPNAFWTWHRDTGLSTIYTGALAAGQNATAVGPDGRVYFGIDSNMLSWKSGSGLSTLLGSAITKAGVYSIAVAADSRVFFGQETTAGQLWTWAPSVASTGPLLRATVAGQPTSQPLKIQLPTGTVTYSTGFQDLDGDLYLSDMVAKNIDRYSFGSSSFSRISQFGWATSTGAVGAVAVDQGTTGIALLDTANKQIDYYTNRKATGSPAATSQFNLTATTSPTGLAISGRTGNYLVVDSSTTGTNPNKYINLFVYNSSGAQVTGSPWKIYLSPGAASGYGLSVDATGESNFKLAYDDRRNVLYLIAPTIGRVYALTLPEAF